MTDKPVREYWIANWRLSDVSKKPDKHLDKFRPLVLHSDYEALASELEDVEAESKRRFQSIKTLVKMNDKYLAERDAALKELEETKAKVIVCPACACDFSREDGQRVFHDLSKLASELAIARERFKEIERTDGNVDFIKIIAREALKQLSKGEKG